MAHKQEIDLTTARTPAWNELSDSDKRSLVWNAVYNDRSLVTDPDDARRLADDVTEQMKRGLAYNEAQHEQWRARLWSSRWNALKRFLGWSTLVLAIGFGIANAIYWPIRVHANDYAHVDPGSVPGQAAQAVRQWFGQNDLPANLQIVEQKHSLLYGQRAWYVLYTGEHGQKVCAYVWSGHDGNYSKVEQGANCQG